METTFYKKNLPDLIANLKTAYINTVKVIERDETVSLADDKLFNALKARKQASEDAIWYAKRIDELENELNGKEVSESEGKDIEKQNWTKKIATQEK